jgi:phosphotransferase system HPr-like phosphotransfer protein
MSLMLLAASNGTTLHFDIRGNDAQDAYRALESLVSNKFGEKE